MESGAEPAGTAPRGTQPRSTRWLDEDQQRAWRSWLDANARIAVALHRGLQASSGLSLADYEVLVALTEDVTNARTEGFNRIIKQTKRVGCGFTNMDNYRRRIMVHIALTRGQRPAA